MNQKQIEHAQIYAKAIHDDGRDLARLGHIPLDVGTLTRLDVIEFTARRMADRAAALRAELHQMADDFTA